MPTGVYFRTKKHLDFLKKLHRTPKTEKQLAASRRNCRKAGKTKKTKKQLKWAKQLFRLALYRRGQNTKEKILEAVLNELFPKEYKFTGDGTFLIGRYNPDFVNCNGQKKIIEHDGTYWHGFEDRKKHDRKRDAVFKSFGYSVLHIRERELNDMNKLKRRLIKFHKAGNS